MILASGIGMVSGPTVCWRTFDFNSAGSVSRTGWSGRCSVSSLGSTVAFGVAGWGRGFEGGGGGGAGVTGAGVSIWDGVVSGSARSQR